MKDLQSKIQQMIRNKKMHSRWLSFMIALSLLIGFAVPFELIMPGIAAAPTNGAVEIKTENGNTLTVQIESGNDTIYAPGGQNEQEFNAGGAEKLDSIYVGTVFSLNGLQGNPILNDQNGPHLYMNLSGLIGADKLILDERAKTGSLIDGVYNENLPAGTYQITDDGYIWLTLTEEYRETIKSGTGTVNGAIQFSGKLGRADNEDGDQVLTFDGKKLTVKFDDKYPQLNSKDGHIDNNRIKWDISLNVPAGTDMSNYTLSDAMLTGAEDITINPNDIQFNSSGQFSGIANSGNYTITYYTPITADFLKDKGTNIQNTAQLKKNNDNVVSEKSYTVDLQPFNLTKSGKADYSDTTNKKINWTIKIENKYGISLNDYLIKDEKIPNDASIKVTPQGELTKDGNNWKLSGVGNASLVEIKYSTPVSDQEIERGGWIQNEAELLYPNNDPTGSKNSTSVQYKKISDIFQLNKNGSVDKDNHTITWNVEVTANDGATLNGYVLTDDQFPSDSSGITVKEFDPNWNQYKYTLSNGTLKIDSGDLTKFKFSYTTPYPDNIPVGSTTAVVNDISDNKLQTTVTATVNVENRKSVSKSVTNGNSYTEASNKEIQKEVNWKVDLICDGSFSGKEYVDTISSPTGGTHTLKEDSIVVKAAVTENDFNYNMQSLDAKYYEIVKTDSGFKVQFKSPIDEQRYNYIRIEYTTVATADEFTGTYGSDGKHTYVFNNSGTFDGSGTGDIGYTINRENPEKDEKMTLKACKSWNGDNAPKADVVAKIKYKENGVEKGYVKADSNGEFLYKGDEGYDTAQDYEFVFENSNFDAGDNGWRVEVPGLRKTYATIDSNGNRGQELKYTYSLEEYKYGDQIVENNRINLNDGFYVVINGGETNDSNFESWLTNKYHPDYSVNVEKQWKDDDIDHTNVKEIKYKIQYKIQDVCEFEDLKIDSDNNLLYRDDNNYYNVTTLFEGTLKAENDFKDNIKLQSGIYINFNDKIIYYRIVETAIVYNDGTNKTISNDKVILDNGYYICSNDGEINGNRDSYKLTNTFHETKNIPIDLTKKWNNDQESTRPSAIKVALQRKPKNNGNWETIKEQTLTANYDWKYHWDGDDPALPNQKIENDNVTEYEYRVVEVGYKNVDDDWVTFVDNTDKFCTTDDGYYYIGSGNNYIDNNGNRIIELDNTFNNIGRYTITPQKSWSNDNEVSGTERPKSIWVKLQRSTDLNSNDWEDVVDAQGNVIEIQISADQYGNWQAAGAFENLPQKEIVATKEGNKTKYDEKTWQYQLVETAYQYEGGEKTEIAGRSFITPSGGGKYSFNYEKFTVNNNENKTITNTYQKKAEFSKKGVNSTGQPITEINSEDLEQYKKTINNVDYYVFNWCIKQANVSGDASETIKPIEDELPEGFELCAEGLTDFTNNKDADWSYQDKYKTVDSVLNGSPPLYSNGYYEQPIVVYEGSFVVKVGVEGTLSNIWGEDKSKEKIYYDQSNRKVYFSDQSAWCDYYILYSTKIRCEDLEAQLRSNPNYTIKNTAQKHDNDGNPLDETAEASIKIKKDIPSGLITKTYDSANPSSIPGIVKFKLDINPNGQNLSTGSTIDITDIFNTVSYTDSCHGNQITNGDKLVDLLLNKMKIKRVDANGVEHELNFNEYTMQFKSGKDSGEGAALLKLVIPDEEHIIVEYEYKIIANENTPSVGKCKGMLNGLRRLMAAGMVPPSGHKITFSNTAKLSTESASGESKVSNKVYEVSESRGLISTTRLPKITKVNVGDYNINNLKAKFLLAQYKNGKWYYAQQIDDKGNITWSTTPCDGKAVDPDAHEIDTEKAYQVAIDQNTLFKLVEVSVPNGYEGSNLGLDDDQFKQLITNYLNNNTTALGGNDYGVFLNNFHNIYYFTNNSTVTALPDGLSQSDVMQIKSGENIEIPNNQLIDLKVKKNWTPSLTGDTGITVQLYWSFTKDTVKIPNGANVAKAADLGIVDANFSNTKTINNSTGETLVWSNLPNGKDGKPIYYYVKETAYTIGDKTYKCDLSGEFKSGDENGGYKPTYIGNAVNLPTSENDATITINNSNQLLLKKVWKDSANNPMEPTLDSICVSIKGVKEDGTEDTIFTDIALNKTNGWQADVSALLGNTNLSDYKSFKAVEKEGDTNLSNYIVSCVFTLNGQTGEITVTNKSTEITEASVTVNKVWSDGADQHENHSVNVKLYRSTTKYDADRIEANKASLTLVEKGKDNKDITSEVTLNKDNDWSYTWNGLELKNSSDQVYHYYALEESISAGSSQYSTAYELTESSGNTKVTITNTRKAITVKKVWLDEHGNKIEDVVDEDGNVIVDNTKDLPPVDIQICDKQVSDKPQESLKILAFGDSITNGDGNGNKGYYDYLLTNLEKSEYGSFKVDKNFSGKSGHSGYAIKAMPYGDDYYKNVQETESRSGVFDCIDGDFSGKQPDIVTLLIGTNDIISNYNKNIDTRLEELIKAIYKNQEKNPDMVIFVGSIPKFKFDSSSSGSYSWFKRYGTTFADKGFTYTTDKYKEQWNASSDDVNAFQTYLNDTVIADYNTKIQNLVNKLKSQGYKIEFVDINSAVTSICSDGCHPDDNGNLEMAAKWAEAINNYYTTYETIETITLNKANNWTASYDVTDDSKHYYVDESSVPEGWQLHLIENNGQLAGSSTPIVVKNQQKTVPKTSIIVKKIWQDDSDHTHDRDSITLNLQRKIETDTEWTTVLDAEQLTPIKNGSEWTFTYENLPQKDNAGNDYYYKIVESPMENYSTAYSDNNKNGIKDSRTDGEITVTNTRNISIKVKKVWSDGNENHSGDAVKVKIYRGVTQNNNDANLTLEILDSVTVNVNGSQTITSNKEISLSDETYNKEVAEVSLGSDKKSVIITGKAVGETDITVTDGTEKITIHIVVSNLTLLVGGESNYTMTVGDEKQLTLSGTDESVSYSIIEGSDFAILNGDILTALKKGKITVKATAGGKEITQAINIQLPDTFTIVGDSEVTEGGTLQLSVDPQSDDNFDYGKITWSLDNSNAAEISQNGLLIANQVDADTQVTVTATREDGKNATLTVMVKKQTVLTGTVKNDQGESYEYSYFGDKLTITVKSNKISSDLKFDYSSFPDVFKDRIPIKFESSSSKILEIGENNKWNQYGGSWNNVTTLEKSDNTIPLSELTDFYHKLYSADTPTITITFKELGRKNSPSRSHLYSKMVKKSAVEMQARLRGGEELLDEITLDVSNGWEYSLSNLPITSEDGAEQYYYWAIEEDVSGYKASYKFDDGGGETVYAINASKLGNGEITIRNTKIESVSVILPETGGRGTRIYYTAGGLLLMLSAVGYVTFKRRKSALEHK